LKTITAFQGEYRFLSNFWPCYMEYDNMLYPTAEHAYQAAKVGDPAIKARISHCDTPAAAKDYMTEYANQAGIDWTIEKKLAVMEELLGIKFGGMNPFLTRALLATGDTLLIEGNTWGDTFWGVCDNAGENNLGKLLMKIREELFREKEQLILLLQREARNAVIAKTLGISERALYEKMIGFGIQNKEYWIL
jgi:ribA/ribD-fused uncharacterized protein